MKTYNFKPQFAPLVEEGKKNCTIRAKGKIPPPVRGETLRLYTGMRTKSCRKLGDFECTAVTPIRITGKASYWNKTEKMECDEESALARRDGHSGIKEFRNFFLGQTGGRPFIGFLIEWNPARQSETRSACTCSGGSSICLNCAKEQMETDQKAKAFLQGCVMRDILLERNRQDRLVSTGDLPWNCADLVVADVEKLAVLAEELGEVAKEIHEKRPGVYRKRLKKELTQLAAVAHAWLESLTTEQIIKGKP